MKRHTPIIAASLMLAAFAPLQGRAAVNTWNNASTDGFWNATSANWTSPTTWVDGNDAIFGATGVGTVTLAAPITVHDQTFNAAGYTIADAGYPLTLAGTTPTITVNADATNAVSLQGTNGLTVQGTGVLTLGGFAGNQYTGGSYVRSGTVVLANGGAESDGTAYAVDSIEALDAGATVKLGSTFDGTTWYGAAQGQIATRSTDFASHLHMTGGTFDLNNDPKNQNLPVPDGTGLIINTGSSVQSGLNVIMDGLDHTYSGLINDGNNGVLIGDNSGQGPGYQIGIVSISGTAGSTWTLAGDNTYSGSTRIDGGTIVKLAGNHSLGIPTTNSLTGPLRVQNGALDLNGHDQTIALMTDGGGPAVKIYNSAVGTVATLTVGYGNEQANRNIGYQLMDNTGVGGIFALRKIITAPFLQGATLVTNCTQGLKDTCVATYSGDTTVDGGTLNVQGPSAISPNSAYRLSTSNYANLWLNYSGDAPCRQLWINGVQQPNGTYGAGTPGIDPTSTGTITVTGATMPNTWNNASTDGFWNATSANWTSPTTWVDGNDAIFGATGVGTVTLAAPITVHDQTFNAAGYTIADAGYPLTLAGTTPTITVNADATNAVSLQGTNGLTVQGTGVLTLGGFAGNQYTGGSYVRSGTVVLANGGAESDGTAYAVDSIEALDAGATVKLGSTFDGTTWYGAAQGQIATRSTDFASHLHMTGGTFDLNNDPKNQNLPVPDGTGLIINTGSSVQSGLNVIMDGLDHTYSGLINDGNNGVLIGDNSGQGPGYQIGIVSISGTAGSTWTLAGDNTYSGSTRIDGGTIVKLAGNHSLGIPTTNSLTGPLRVQNGALDLNGHDQTIALMTDGGGPAVKIYNSAVGTVATLTVGYGNEQANRNIGYQLMDNTGVGGIFALRKIITAPFLQGATLVTNCTQGLKDTCVATYSGDTTVDGGTLNVQGPSAISPNSAYRLSTSNYANLWLNYSGDAPCRQLWINGVQQPNGTYGSIGNSLGAIGVDGIDPASLGTITVTGYAPVSLGVTQSGSNLNFSWAGVYKLQSSTNNVAGPYSDYVGAGLNAATVPINPAVGAVYFRLANY